MCMVAQQLADICGAKPASIFKWCFEDVSSALVSWTYISVEDERIIHGGLAKVG